MKDPTVADIIKEYLAELELEHKAGAYSDAALASARYYLDSFGKMFGGQRMSQCRKRDITTWIVAHPEWGSSHTKIDASAWAVRCFRWADEEDLIDRTPFRRPRRLWAPPQPREPISIQEFQALLRVAKESDGIISRCKPARSAFRLAIWFLWETGCRTCEMRSARFVDVDWKRRVLVLAEHKTARSTGQARILPLGRAYRLIRWLFRHRQPGQEHIFVKRCGSAWSKDEFSRIFRSFARLAGVREEVSAYGLRHGFTVQALENGVGERQLADVLGHASTRYVAWYGRKTRARANHLRNVLDQAHGRPESPPPDEDEPPAPALVPAPPDPPRTNPGAEFLRKDADRFYADMLPIMRRMRAEGATLLAIAKHLNDNGLQTRFCRPWSGPRVRQILMRK